MTLILTVNGRKSIWLLADRRLSREGTAPKDDGRKVFCLEAADGVAILGYAGLGATRRTEPSDWMSAVLRGPRRALEHSLNVLAAAAKRELPPFLLQMPESYVPTHAIMVPAFVGKQPRLYTIDIAFAPDRSDHQFLYQRRLIYRPGMTSPRTQQGVGAAGTGAVYVRDAMPRTWIRDLVRKVKAHDRGQMSPEFVADHLATLNYEVHQKIEPHLAPDKKTVGPRCIVVWRRSMARLHRGGPKGGGGNMYYTGTTRDRGGAGIAIIGGGMDIRAIIDAIVQNPLHPNLSTVPVLPDEKLR